MPKPRDTRPTTTAVRLTRKYADMIDGVNLKDAKVGDRLDLPRRDAEVLMAEGWAEKAENIRSTKAERIRATAHDGSKRAPRRKT